MCIVCFLLLAVCCCCCVLLACLLPFVGNSVCDFESGSIVAVTSKVALWSLVVRCDCPPSRSLKPISSPCPAQYSITRALILSAAPNPFLKKCARVATRKLVHSPCDVSSSQALAVASCDFSHLAGLTKGFIINSTEAEPRSPL